MTDNTLSANKDSGIPNGESQQKINYDTNVVTFGCRLNTFESEVIKQHIEKANLKNTIVFNTCAVTSEAERQARQSIRRMKRENPDATIVVTGCAAQIHAKEFSNMDEVDMVIGNQEKMNANTYQNIEQQQSFIGNHEKIRVNDIMDVKEISGHLVTSFDGHTRAFVQVQNGCNHRCTFCIIPYGRGNSRSVPMTEIINQIKILLEQGYKEVVLTGVDISSYGEDLPGKPTLGEMTKRILTLVPDLPRLRISSIDCIEIDDTLFNVLEHEPRLMPHLHLSLQSGDPMILKRMARRHSSQDIVELCQRLRKARPDLTLGADIIAGFPTETDEMFQNTIDIIKQCDVSWIHAFPYSERKGTPAERIPNQVPVPIRKKRAQALRDLGKKMQESLFQRKVGTMASVLVEKNNRGYCEHFAPVKILGDTVIEEGRIVTVKITDFTSKHLIATIEA